MIENQEKQYKENITIFALVFFSLTLFILPELGTMIFYSTFFLSLAFYMETLSKLHEILRLNG